MKWAGALLNMDCHLSYTLNSSFRYISLFFWVFYLTANRERPSRNHLDTRESKSPDGRRINIPAFNGSTINKTITSILNMMTRDPNSQLPHSTYQPNILRILPLLSIPPSHCSKQPKRIIWILVCDNARVTWFHLLINWIVGGWCQQHALAGDVMPRSVCIIIPPGTR